MEHYSRGMEKLSIAMENISMAMEHYSRGMEKLSMTMDFPKRPYVAVNP